MDTGLTQYLVPLIAALLGYLIKHFFPGLIPLPGGPVQPPPTPLPLLDAHPLWSSLVEVLRTLLAQKRVRVDVKVLPPEVVEPH